jgi:cell wall-associated NlpC family hydrolase
MGYNRKSAVNYALKYGPEPNHHYQYFKIYGNLGGDCTNFVSQCLYEAGIPMMRGNIAPWWYQDPETWSVAWVNSHSLYWCLRIRYENNLIGPKGKIVSDVSELELGDLIFYEDEHHQIDHSAIITGFKDGLPTITQHSPELVNIHYIKTNKTAMHFMKIMNE